MKAKGKKSPLEKVVGLSFGEAMQRFAQTDFEEVKKRIDAEKRKVKGGEMPPSDLASGG